MARRLPIAVAVVLSGFVWTLSASAADPAGEGSPQPCDVTGDDGWSAERQSTVEGAPESNLSRCREISALARARIDSGEISLPAPCSAFAPLSAEREQVAVYNWAYPAISHLRARGKTERAARIEKALAAYNEQFETYHTRLAEFRGLCVRVNGSPRTATAKDVLMRSQSGRRMIASIGSARTAVWDKGGIKSTLDRSFGSVAKALK